MSFPLRPPESVIEPSEDAGSIGAALLFRASLAPEGRPVTALLDAIVGLLTDGARRQ